MKLVLFQKRHRDSTYTLNESLSSLNAQGRAINLVRQSVAYDSSGTLVAANTPVYEEVA